MRLYLNKKDVDLIYSLLRIQCVSNPFSDDAERARKIYHRMKKCEKLQNQTTKGKTKKMTIQEFRQSEEFVNALSKIISYSKGFKFTIPFYKMTQG